jgi:hypothetical protein
MIRNDLERALSALGRIPVERIEEICDAERNGRCVVLPCKVGDTVYSTSPNQDKVIACYVPSLHTIARWIEDGVFGKTVFLTRAEAEEALKEAQHE